MLNFKIIPIMHEKTHRVVWDLQSQRFAVKWASLPDLSDIFTGNEKECIKKASKLNKVLA